MSVFNSYCHASSTGGGVSGPQGCLAEGKDQSPPTNKETGMQCVIVNDEGELYGGFSSENSKPVWFRTKREGCVLDEATADMVLRQLIGLGFEKVAKRDADGVLRKWVPADLDASGALDTSPSATHARGSDG